MSTVVIGRHTVFRNVVEQACRVSTGQIPFLICGEPGTGKQLLARLIHQRSGRRSLPFLVVSSETLSETPQGDGLADVMQGEACLADRTIAGLFRSARGGTLYLKNLERLSLPLQEAMVPYVMDGHPSALSVERTGLVATRILASTTIPLDVLDRCQVLHPTLYGLMAQYAVTIPPLRERGSDVVLLAQYFAQLYGRQSCLTRLDLSEAVLKRLLTYGWPGNVQELEDTIVRTSLIGDLDGPVLPLLCPTVESISQTVQTQVEPRRSTASFRQAKALAIEQFERDYLTRLMSEHRGNVSGAARSAKTERRTFQRLLRKYRLVRGDFLKSA